jgi:hypothetical protein
MPFRYPSELKGNWVGYSFLWGKEAMKYISVLLGSLLFVVVNAGAQANFGDSVTLTAPEFMTYAMTPAPPATPASPAANSPAIFAAPAFASPAAPALPAAMPQEVQGVFNKYSWDLYAGYTFYRFYEVPGINSNMNGGNISAVYYYRDWLGADGELMAVYGSQPGQNSWLVFGGLGPRLRYVGPKGIDVWAHAMIGGIFIDPRTPYGGTSAFAGLVGAGVDLNAHHRRVALRVAIDGIVSNFFATYQISPKASVGIVYKF